MIFMMSFIGCIIFGAIMGIIIAKLSKNPKYAESTRIFTDDKYVEENVQQIIATIKKKF